jgi:hypothetical protein
LLSLVNYDINCLVLTCFVSVWLQVHVPEGLTALDLDLIKLTAQFVARNGAAFLTGAAHAITLAAGSGDGG